MPCSLRASLSRISLCPLQAHSPSRDLAPSRSAGDSVRDRGSPWQEHQGLTRTIYPIICLTNELSSS